MHAHTHTHSMLKQTNMHTHSNILLQCSNAVRKTEEGMQSSVGSCGAVLSDFTK